MERIVSYAENGEDIILYHVLKGIESKIFWIDAGASDPWEYSVTQMFYEMGGHGINIEPRKSAYENLVQYRENDYNFFCGVGEKEGKIKFLNEATSGSKEVIKEYEKSGKKLSYTSIPIKTVTQIVDEIEIKSDIHFFKIDVEGMEMQVLKGTDFKRIRPWVICIESCIGDGYKEWDDYIIKNHYELALVDTINRWYISAEHKDLKSKFRTYDTLREMYDVHLLRRADLIDTQIKWAVEGNAFYKFGKTVLFPVVAVRRLIKRKRVSRYD